MSSGGSCEKEAYVAVTFRSAQQVQVGGYGAVAADRTAIEKLMGGMIIHFAQSTPWGNVKSMGSCRAAALRFAAGHEMLFGCSDRPKKEHAEDALIPQINLAWGGAFEYMLVDIEPCHSGRYASHDCKLNIANAFAFINATVVYLFEQDKYESGMNELQKSSAAGTQDLIILLKTLIGVTS
jgi:hypothetical protein